MCVRKSEKNRVSYFIFNRKIEEQDRINGFLMGGDDYILKPFSIEELGARVMAHIRREKRRQPVKDDQKGFVISYSQRSVFMMELQLHLQKQSLIF